MRNVSVRDLRNNGGRVLERVINGELVTVTLDGRPVAELLLFCCASTTRHSSRRTAHYPSPRRDAETI
jgi:antitoxin (DNA-binding transcriptional repressor) of toxin-antitoxin stability system